MKPQYETRTHISSENYSKITALRNKYGEVQFRMAISHLFSLGYNTFKKITEAYIEKDYKKNIEDNKEDLSIMTPEFIQDLNLCALELSKIDHILLMKFITNYVFFDIK